MDAHKARAFLVLAEELHFGRAARRLHMAQPPLSRLIRQLEAELEAPLFERSTRAVRLTPQGEALIEPAREFVALAQRMREVVRRAAAGDIGRIRLGFSGASLNHLVAEFVRGLRRDRPGLVVELASAQLSHPGLERLLDGSLDLLLGRWDFLPNEIESRVIAREELLVAMPTGHRLATRTEVVATDLADESWVVLPGGSGATLSNRLHLLGLNGRFVPRVVQTAPDSATELLLVDSGVGVALTLSGVRDNLPVGGVVFRPVTPSLGGVAVRLAWRSGDESPSVVAALEVSRRVFPERG